MIDSMLNILPIMLLLSLGLLLKKKQIIGQRTVSDLKLVVANIALPALLLKGFMKVTLSREYLVVVLIMFLIPIVMLTVGKLFNKILGIRSRYFPFLLSGFEMGMFGYALFLTVFGTENLPVVAIVDLGQVLFVFFILIPSLNSPKSGKHSIKSVAGVFIKSPVIIAILSGLLLGGVGFSFDGNSFLLSTSKFIDIVGGLTMPLIMISLGYEIEFKKDGLLKAIKTVVVRKSLLLIFALLVNKVLILGVLNLPELYQYAVLIMFLMPPPFVISIFMDQEDRESLGYVTNTLSISILVSVLILIPLLP